MAWKYRQEYVKDGDVVEPSDFRINVNEFASEINGFLDSDNIGRESISSAKIKRETFTEVYSNDLSSRFSYIFRHDTSGWQKDALATVTLDVTLSPTAPLNPAATTFYEESDLSVEKTKLPSVTFKPSQDGLLICEFSGFVDWLPYGLNDSDDKPQKIFEPKMEYSFFAKQNKKFKMVNSFVLSSMWRLTVNGQSVAETGPLGNDYRSHPIYLCGSTPVIKNQETVVQLECQLIWYSMGKDTSIPSSALDPTSEVTFTDGAVGVTSSDGKKIRHDCSLNCPMLIATYRKR